MTTEEKIIEHCDKIKRMLIEKNKSYGEAALNPIRIFSKLNNTEQLKVRLDDKLSRIARGEISNELINESYIDTLENLIGYLHLLAIAEQEK